MRTIKRPSGARGAGERRCPQAAPRRRAAGAARPWPSAALALAAAVASAPLAAAARQRPRAAAPDAAAAAAGLAGAALPDGGPPPPDAPAASRPAPAWAPELLEGAAAAVVVKFQHVDFARLSRDPALRGRLEKAASDTLAAELLQGGAAAAAPRVDLRLFSAGRTAGDRGGEEETAALARVFVSPPGGAGAQQQAQQQAQLQARLCSDGLLAEALALAVANLDGIARASTGAVGAGNAITGSSWLCSPQPVVTVSFPHKLHGDALAAHRAGEHAGAPRSFGDQLRYFVMTGELPWGQAHRAAAEASDSWEAQGGELHLQLSGVPAEGSAAAGPSGAEGPLAQGPAPAPQPTNAETPEGEAVCDPLCGENGVCVDGACFCKHPFYGVSCGRFSFTGVRVHGFSILLSCAAASIVGVALGYASHARWFSKDGKDGTSPERDPPRKGRETWIPEDPDE